MDLNNIFKMITPEMIGVSISKEESEEENITFMKYYSEDKFGNSIPDELIYIYAVCRSKPDIYPDVNSNEWNHIFSLKSMMYASIKKENINAVNYIAPLLEIYVTDRAELLGFYSYLKSFSVSNSYNKS